MSIVDKLRKVFQGKQKVVESVNNKAGSTLPDTCDWDTLSETITNISTGTDTNDATATANDILKGKTAYGVEGKMEGTIETYNLEMSEGGVSEKNTMALALADELTHLTPSDTNGATTIKDYACYGAKALVSVELADTVERIGDSAFRFCTNLTSVNLPNVKHLDAYVFDNCSNLTTVISPNVEIIYSRAFYSCYRITNLSFGNVTSIHQLAFNECGDCLIYDFSNCLQVPKLANVNAFDGINTDAKIKVPNALYNDWIVADKWSSFIDYIVAV